jgi:Flp pilus assembly pilin Flp
MAINLYLRLLLSGRRPERGQGTVEYALILLGAAAVALVVVAWVTNTDLIGRLFDTVVGRILDQAG